MRILHTSHSGLPDSRIEKTALTMKKYGHDLFFLGGLPSKENSPVFTEIHHEPTPSGLRIVLDSKFKRRWMKAIDRIKPDVVHAHNLIAAAMMLESEYPTIYDDHEYWSQQSFRYSTRSFLRRIAAKPLIRASPKWERQIIEKYPVITVSDNIAADHKEISGHVFVTKNYPLLEEVQQLSNNESRDGIVYIGNDFNLPKFQHHRNMEGLQDILNFDILTGLKHNIMMERLTQYKIGLVPWRSHPFHRYCDPNKTYEYLNAGLQVLLTNTLMHPFEDERFVYTFETYDEISELIHSLPDIDSGKIMNHAKENYVWETQEGIIRNVYNLI